MPHEQLGQVVDELQYLIATAACHPLSSWRLCGLTTYPFKTPFEMSLNA